MNDTTVHAQARRWMDEDPDAETRAEVQALLDAGDDAGLEDEAALWDLSIAPAKVSPEGAEAPASTPSASDAATAITTTTAPTTAPLPEGDPGKDGADNRRERPATAPAASRPAAPSPRCAHSAVLIGEVVYVFGGHGGERALHTGGGSPCKQTTADAP